MRALLAGALLLVVGLSPGCSPGASEPPHIVLITSDTLRADHLSMNGYPRATSPSLDAFAGDSRNFSRAITVIPKTAPAFATLFTGQHPRTHGVRSNLEIIPTSMPVLAERLREQGYRTAAFVSNPVLREDLGFSRGFDHYEMHVEEGEVAAVNRSFEAWAAAPWDRPTFVWLHYIDPHGPYTPPEPYAGMFVDDALSRSEERVPLQSEPPPSGNPNKLLGAIPEYQVLDGEDRLAVYVARYDAEIRLVDDAFADVLSLLRARELYEKSAILFTSDHGESLGEHDFYFEHGWFAYEPTLHIPLMIRPPGDSRPADVDGLVSLVDLLPTLLSLAGLPADSGLPGADLLAPLPQERAKLVENSDRYPEKYLGLRTARWKYLKRVSDGAEELYDLEQDPQELHDLSAERTDVVAEMRGKFEAMLRDMAEGAEAPADVPSIDEETRERLKSLGYVD